MELELFWNLVSGQVWIISITLFYFYVMTRHKQLVYIMVVLILNWVINVVLKQIIHQLRPGQTECSWNTCGMPSGHSQYIACFFIMFFMLVFIEWDKGVRNQALYLKLTCLFSLFMVLSRQSLGYHTDVQGYIGLLVGFLIGLPSSLLYMKWYV